MLSPMMGILTRFFGTGDWKHELEVEGEEKAEWGVGG